LDNCHGVRVLKYLQTIELETDVDLEDFVKNDSIQRLDDVHYATADTIAQKTKNVIEYHSLSFDNLIFFMSDNCSTMRGRRGGAAKKIMDISPNCISVPGCMSHQCHLVQKAQLKAGGQKVITIILRFLEMLSDFLTNTPKARIILKQVDRFLNLKKFSTFNATRFLDFYTSLQSVQEKFPVITKLVQISNNTELKSLISFKDLEIHIDLCLAQTKPLYTLCKQSQGVEITYYSFLIIVLETISQILVRCGQVLQLDPGNCFEKLFDEDNGNCRPKNFANENRDIHYARQF